MLKNEKEMIPVVFATNDAYIPLTGIAICSLLQHTSEKYFYDIYVMHKSMGIPQRRRLESLKTPNTNITILDCKPEWTKNLGRLSSKIQTMLYRLLIPELLPQYEKVLYLDCDIIVLGDVAELYQYDISNNIFGAGYDGFGETWIKHYKDFGLDAEHTFNSGVLLINRKRFMEERVKEKCFGMLEEDPSVDFGKRKYELPDQDVLNIVCYKKVFHFPLNWNFPAMHLDERFTPTELQIDRFNEAKKDIKILHYAGEKPFVLPDMVKADVWWSVARQTIFYEEMLKMMADNAAQERVKAVIRFPFPWKKIKNESRIIIYGAGGCGKAYRIQADIYYPVILQVDRNWKETRVSPPEEIFEIDSEWYDYIVIAITNEKAINEIRENLLAHGIPERKIVIGEGECFPNCGE